MKLSEWMRLSREERTAHIDLSTPCVFGTHRKDTRPILRFHDLDCDVENWTEARIHRCHLCENGRRNGDCSNPKHMYLGTASENSFDISPSKRKSIQDAVAKAKAKSIKLEHISTGQIFQFMSQHEAARQLSLSQGALSGLLHGSRKTHKGFRIHLS